MHPQISSLSFPIQAPWHTAAVPSNSAHAAKQPARALAKRLAYQWIVALSGICLLTACTNEDIANAQMPALVDYGPAPEFEGIQQWLNSAPLTLSALRGKVVLIDFWTYSCINCIRTLPYITQWHKKYKDQGLVVIGVHTPEFVYERETQNVEKAMQRFNIDYPVAQDNRYATWKAYENQYWPAVYLIDRTGKIVLKHFGEGGYGETERAIQHLLASPLQQSAASIPGPTTQ